MCRIQKTVTDRSRPKGLAEQARDTVGFEGDRAITLQDLGSLGELIAAVAVVVSLLYVAVQVRQNSRSIRAANYQTFSESYREFRVLLLKDESLRIVWAKGLQSRSQLSGSDQAQFDNLMMIFTRVAETNFYHASNGLVDESFLSGWLEEAIEIWRMPGVQDWWADNKRFFNIEFRASWDLRLAKP